MADYLMGLRPYRRDPGTLAGPGIARQSNRSANVWIKGHRYLADVYMHTGEDGMQTVVLNLTEHRTGKTIDRFVWVEGGESNAG